MQQQQCVSATTNAFWYRLHSTYMLSIYNQSHWQFIADHLSYTTTASLE
jgi:hypothetical protein